MDKYQYKAHLIDKFNRIYEFYIKIDDIWVKKGLIDKETIAKMFPNCILN